MTSLLRRCCECGKIKVNDKWVGKRYKHYNELINNPDVIITDGYCPQHLYNNQIQRELAEKRKSRMLSK